MKNLIAENLIKNIIVVLLLIPGYISIQTSVSASGIVSDKTALGSILVAVSILAVTACFGNFSFTYEKVENNKRNFRLLAHTTTGLLMLLIGLSLEMTSIITGLLIGNFPVFDFSLLLLYFASVLYDFWDLRRADL